jgi:hypothetical protein
VSRRTAAASSAWPLYGAHHPEDQQANRLTWSRRVLGRKTAALAGIGSREGCERDHLHRQCSQLRIAVLHGDAIELGLHDDSVRTAQEKAHPRPGIPAYQRQPGLADVLHLAELDHRTRAGTLGQPGEGQIAVKHRRGPPLKYHHARPDTTPEPPGA